MRGRDIKAILFDMDGTLFDTELKMNELIHNLVREHYNLDIVLSDEELAGLSCAQKVEKVLGKEDPDFLNTVIKIASSEYPKMAQPIEGVIYFLGRMKKQGFKIAVCTNGEIDLLKEAFEKLEVEFDLLQGTNGGDIRKKPEPDVYLEGMKKLGVTTDEVLIIEDSKPGINSAIAAGITEGHIIEFDQYKINQNTQNRFHGWEEFAFDPRAVDREDLSALPNENEIQELRK
jgi:HAD superfamily hydrolase (TIGR01509 family)